MVYAPAGIPGRSPGRCGLPMRCATDSCRACRVLRYRCARGRLCSPLKGGCRCDARPPGAEAVTCVRLRAWVGYKQVGVPVERRDRGLAGVRKYSLRDLIGLALDEILAFSVVPLRIATALGALGLLRRTPSMRCSPWFRRATRRGPGHRGHKASPPLRSSRLLSVALCCSCSLWERLGQDVGRSTKQVEGRPV